MIPEYHLFFYAQLACHLQSGGGVGSHSTERSLHPCLYGHCQDRETRRQHRGGTKIKAHKLPSDATGDFARDIFLFSLYTYGTSLTDIAHLEKSDLQGDYLSYCCQKTGQHINSRWEVCMQQLVDKYRNEDSPTCFLSSHVPVRTRQVNTQTRYSA